MFFIFEKSKMEYINEGDDTSLAQGVPRKPPQEIISQV